MFMDCVELARVLAKGSHLRPARQMVALLVRHGVVVAYAVNNGVHAEDRLALENTFQTDDAVYVYRFRVDGQLGNSKPCSSCLTLLGSVRAVGFMDNSAVYEGSPCLVEGVKESFRYPAERFAHRGGPADMAAA
jgi:hypothetical protein